MDRTDEETKTSFGVGKSTQGWGNLICGWIEQVRWEKPHLGLGPSRQGEKNLIWGWLEQMRREKPPLGSRVSGMEPVLGALTFVRRHQQIQSLLGQVWPDQRDLLPQLSVTLVLLDTSCSQGERSESLSWQHIPLPTSLGTGEPAQPFPAQGIHEFSVTEMHELSRTILASPWGP